VIFRAENNEIQFLQPSQRQGVKVEVDPNVELNLTLTAADVQAILIALLEAPAKVCNPLTKKIQDQVAPQLKPLADAA
jgi:adenine-specific DNA methylase